jgi:hypothetical protein
VPGLLRHVSIFALSVDSGLFAYVLGCASVFVY